MNSEYPQIYLGTDFHTVKIRQFTSGLSQAIHTFQMLLSTGSTFDETREKKKRRTEVENEKRKIIIMIQII